MRDFITMHSHAPQGHGSRNGMMFDIRPGESVMPRRGMGVEIAYLIVDNIQNMSCPAGAWE